MIYFIYDLGHKGILVGTKKVVFLCLILMLSLKKIIRRGCNLYTIVTMNNKDDTMNMVQHPILLIFLVMFLEDLPGLLPKWELDFMNEIKP